MNKTKYQLDLYFKDQLKSFSLPLFDPGSAFQKSVWKGLQEIPFGKVVSYHQLAKDIGNPKAVRAVGKANGSNRIAIVIPCHCVIGAGGNLVGYSAGGS